MLFVCAGLPFPERVTVGPTPEPAEVDIACKHRLIVEVQDAGLDISIFSPHRDCDRHLFLPPHDSFCSFNSWIWDLQEQRGLIIMFSFHFYPHATYHRC